MPPAEFNFVGFVLLEVGLDMDERSLWLAIALLAVVAFAGSDLTSLGILGTLLVVGSTKEGH